MFLYVEESVEESGCDEERCDDDDIVLVVNAKRNDQLLSKSPSKELSACDETSQSSTVPTTTLPDTPPRSVSSSSTSRGSKQRQRPGFSPQSIAYNPVTCHSPHTRRRRHEIMGISIIRRDSRSTGRAESDDDDASVENSEAALVCASMQIRSDLLTTEMLELAAEAERAAEAGEDRFAAQPWVLQGDHGVVPVSPKPAGVVRRSHSEGTRAMSPNRKVFLRRRPSSTDYQVWNQTKLSVVDLRDVHEVFPSFRQFHTHLRTHLFRQNVNQDQLYFEEQRMHFGPFEDREITTIKSEGEMPLSATVFRSQRLPPMLGSFRLDKWIRDSRKATEGSVGEVVSNHITTRSPQIMGRVDVPPGLDEEASVFEEEESVTRDAGPRIHTNNKIGGDSYTTWGLGSLFHIDKPTKSKKEAKETRSPEYNPPPESTPSPYREFHNEDIRDFVTPERLRKIRRRRKGRNNQEERGLVMPANSLAEDSPQKKTRSEESHSPKLVLPPSLTRSSTHGRIKQPSPTNTELSAGRTANSDSARSLTPTELFSGTRHTLRRDSGRHIGVSENSLLELPAVPPSTDFYESDCGCLSLSPHGSAGESDDDSVIRNNRLSRSARSERQRRQPMSDSGRRSQRALYARSTENDDFMSNFMYCSNKSGGGETLHTRQDDGTWEPCAAGYTACGGEGNNGYCCAALFDDALGVEMLFHGDKKDAPSNSWVRLGNTSSAKVAESWFELANDRFDAALEHVLGGGASRLGPFRAPKLKKKSHHGYITEETDSVNSREQESKEEYHYDIDDKSTPNFLLLEAQLAAA